MIILIIIIISITCFMVFPNIKKGNNKNENLGANNEQESIIENNRDNATRFNNTKELEEFYTTTTLTTGEEMTVTGLDMIFSTALEDKFSKAQSGNGGTVYSQIVTAVGPSKIKGFAIDENIIGGYIIYYHYETAKGSTMKGYYLYDKAFAIKVTNWNGLNNLRNNRI